MQYVSLISPFYQTLLDKQKYFPLISYFQIDFLYFLLIKSFLQFAESYMQHIDVLQQHDTIGISSEIKAQCKNDKFQRHTFVITFCLIVCERLLSMVKKVVYVIPFSINNDSLKLYQRVKENKDARNNLYKYYLNEDLHQFFTDFDLKKEIEQLMKMNLLVIFQKHGV